MKKQVYDSLHQTAKAHQNLGYFKSGEPVIYSESGFRYVKLNFPPHFKIDFGSWGKTLKTIGFKLKYCNPEISLQELVDYLHHLFNEFVKIPYGLLFREGGGDMDYARLKVMRNVDDIIDEIALAIHQTPVNEINVSYNADCNYLFNPDYNLNPDERSQLRMELQANIRVRKKKKQLFKAVLQMIFNGVRITKKGLARYANVSVNTVKKYYVTVIRSAILYLSGLRLPSNLFFTSLKSRFVADKEKMSLNNTCHTDMEYLNVEFYNSKRLFISPLETAA